MVEYDESGENAENETALMNVLFNRQNTCEVVEKVETWDASRRF